MTIPKQASFIAVATVIATLMAVVSTSHAAFPSNCAAGKEKCSGKDAASRLGCHYKAEGKGVAVDRDLPLGSAGVRSIDSYAKLDFKGGCFTMRRSGDDGCGRRAAT